MNSSSSRMAGENEMKRLLFATKKKPQKAKGEGTGPTNGDGTGPTDGDGKKAKTKTKTKTKR